MNSTFVNVCGCLWKCSTALFIACVWMGYLGWSLLLIFAIIDQPVLIIYELCCVLQWALMTLLDPARSLENLIYIGYPDDPSSAIRVTKRRHLDRRKQQSERNVFQCFVFGPANAGKSTLMNSFLGRYSLEFLFLIANSLFPIFLKLYLL